MLIEHYGGAFPVWLAPVQAVVIPVAPAFEDYARRVKDRLSAVGIRAEKDLSDNRMNAKIRNAQNEKIPYMLVVGEREEQESAVSVRKRSGERENGVSLEDFIESVQGVIARKELL